MSNQSLDNDRSAIPTGDQRPAVVEPPPGPWGRRDEHYEEDGRNVGYTNLLDAAGNDLGITIYNTGHGNLHGAKRRATARLVAAAPDLLDALEQALDDMGGEGHSVCEIVKQQMRAAIAKATGAQS